MKKILTVTAICLVALVSATYYGLDPETNRLDDAARKRIGGSYVQLSDGITHYAFTGPVDGKVVVLVHGGTVPMWGWDKQVQALATAGYRVLVYDHFGRGYSDRPKVPYDRTLYVRQLSELVERLSLPNQFDLVGVSFGSAIATTFAANHPQRVRSLVLISPLIENFRTPRVFHLPVIGEFAARVIGIDMISDRFSKLVEGSPDADRYKQLFVEQTTYEGFQRSLLSMVRSDALGDYSREYRQAGKHIHSALLVWGTEDVEISRSMIDEIRSSIPDIVFKPVEGAGHGLTLQRPDIANQLIVDFLGPRSGKVAPSS